MKTIFKIKGLDCANCAMQLEDAIQKIIGVKSVSINFMMEKMTLEYDDNGKDEILKKMKKLIKKEETDVAIEEF